MLDDHALRPARALLHPLWLASCVLLVLNDHVFKGAGLFAAIVTGKLSDFAGLIVAPALLAALVKARSRRGIALSHLAIGLGFAALQLAPAARLAEQLMTPLAWRIWPDPTDLLALPALAVSWRVLVPAMARPLAVASRLRESAQVGASTVGLIACLGTSSVPPDAPPGAPPAPEPEAPVATPLSLAVLAGTWRSEGEDGFTQYRFDGDRYVAGGHPAFHESGRVELVRSTDRELVVRLVDRVLEGQPDAPLELTIAVLSDDALSFDGRRFARVAQQVAAAADAEVVDEVVP